MGVAGILAGLKKKNAALVAATKYASADQINLLLSQGVTAIGENRVQDAAEKFPLLKECERHFIGTIQSNKISKIAALFDVVQSLDSLGHAKKLDAACARSGKKMRVFVQVNAGSEEQKRGIPLDEGVVREFMLQLRRLPDLSLEGIMVVTPEGQGPEYFPKAKSLFDSLKPEFGLKYLSMGVSDDFEEAVAAGANMVRVGRLLFS